MLWLYDNIVVFIVAVITCLCAWLYGGSVAAPLLKVLPWLLIVLFEVMLCFPQRKPNETTYDARARVWLNLKKDPILWITLFFLLLLLIPFLNTALCPLCDAEAIAAGENPNPAIPFLPYCVKRMEHLNVFLWFATSLMLLLAVRHSLLKHGKRAVIECVVWNGIALAIIGAIQQVTQAPGPLWNDFSSQINGAPRAYFFSTFGYPNMGGDYFVTLFGLSIAVWRWRLEEARLKKIEKDSQNTKINKKEFAFAHFYLIPAILFFLSAMMTLSRAAILLVSTTAFLYFIHMFCVTYVRLSNAKRIKAIVGTIVASIAFAFIFVTFMPEDVSKELSTVDAVGTIDRISGKQQYHVRVATKIWKENFLFGCGGWGYKHFCIPNMTREEWKSIQKVGGINVHNDYLQFLAEHGTVGFVCIVAIVILTILPTTRVWRRLAKTIRFLPMQEKPPRPREFFVLPAPVLCIFTTSAATLIHAFADCPFRSAAVISLFFVSLAAMDGYLPNLDETNS